MISKENIINTLIMIYALIIHFYTALQNTIVILGAWP